MKDLPNNREEQLDKYFEGDAPYKPTDLSIEESIRKPLEIWDRYQYFTIYLIDYLSSIRYQSRNAPKEMNKPGNLNEFWESRNEIERKVINTIEKANRKNVKKWFLSKEITIKKAALDQRNDFLSTYTKLLNAIYNKPIDRVLKNDEELNKQFTAMLKLAKMNGTRGKRMPTSIKERLLFVLEQKQYRNDLFIEYFKIYPTFIDPYMSFMFEFAKNNADTRIPEAIKIFDNLLKEMRRRISKEYGIVQQKRDVDLFKIYIREYSKRPRPSQAEILKILQKETKHIIGLWYTSVMSRFRQFFDLIKEEKILKDNPADFLDYVEECLNLNSSKTNRILKTIGEKS